MGDLIRTVEGAFGLVTYIYACDFCGEEVRRYHPRKNTIHRCPECSRRMEREKAHERSRRRLVNVRHEALDEFKAALEHDCSLNPINCNPNTCPFNKDNECGVVAAYMNLMKVGGKND